MGKKMAKEINGWQITTFVLIGVLVLGFIVFGNNGSSNGNDYCPPCDGNGDCVDWRSPTSTQTKTFTTHSAFGGSTTSFGISVGNICGFSRYARLGHISLSRTSDERIVVEADCYYYD